MRDTIRLAKKNLDLNQTNQLGVQKISKIDQIQSQGSALILYFKNFPFTWNQEHKDMMFLIENITSLI